MRDEDAFIAYSKTMDPNLQKLVEQQGAKFDFPVVRGWVRPRADDDGLALGDPQCRKGMHAAAVCIFTFSCMMLQSHHNYNSPHEIAPKPPNPPTKLQYMGPSHPPPQDPSNPSCNLPWEAPFSPAYKDGNGTLKLTQCNWYLPQGPAVPAIQR